MTSDTTMRMKLFLSHATVDAALVNLVTTRLVPLGVTVYAAEYDNKAGADVHEKVRAEIRVCDLMVVLLTRAGHASVYVQQEIGFGLAEGKIVIPIVTPEVEKANLGMLADTEYIVYNEIEPASGLHLLSQRIEELSRQHIQLQKQREDFLFVGGLLVCVGVILLALNE